ncbi:MAG: prepilin-type N-terminal cleavage/methylation domain-containing protein [Merdibacter sp.]
MHDKNAGFTMVEMCLVLAIVTILLAVFSAGAIYDTDAAHIDASSAEFHRNRAERSGGSGSGAHRAHTGNQAISEQRQLQLPASVSWRGRSCTFIHSTHPHRQRRSAVRMAVGSRW